MPGSKKVGKLMKLKKNPHQTNSETIDVFAFDDGDLSNYAAMPIQMPIQTPKKGNVMWTFHTVEHYVQYMKDPGNDAYLDEILKSTDPQHARNEGLKHGGFIPTQAMKDAIDAKAAQHPKFADALEKTGKACLVEDTGTRSKKNQDGKWGFKLGGKTGAYTNSAGKPDTFDGNLLGRMLMEKRNELHRKKGNHALVEPDPKGASNEVKNVMQQYYKGKSLIVTGQSTDIDPRYYATQFATVTPSHKPASKTPSTSHHHGMFTKTKPQPDKPEVKAASSTLVSEIKTKDKEAISAASDCIIRKGNINGTFKVGFTNPAEAQVFFDRLQAKCAELGIDPKDITYHKNDLYPMDKEGRVVPRGDRDAKFSHIVRFEVSTDALKYLDNIAVERSLYNTIMGEAPRKKLSV